MPNVIEINDFSAPELDIYARLTENQLVNRADPENALFIADPRLTAEGKLAVVLGTEGDGLANDTIEHCDYTVRIPMSHGVDSLNVAAASAVAFYQLGKNNK